MPALGHESKVPKQNTWHVGFLYPSAVAVTLFLRKCLLLFGCFSELGVLVAGDLNK